MEENNQKGYKLSLSGESFKGMIIQLLETLKKDQITLDKINQISKEKKVTTSKLDNKIKEIQESSKFEDKTCEVMIWQEKGKLTKIAIKSETIEITLSKKAPFQYELQANITSTNQGETNQILMQVNYEGVSTTTTQENVNENYQIEQTVNHKKISYHYNNQITFTNSIETHQLTNENAMILNNYEEEQVKSFLGQVEERIQKVNKEQMEELGLKEEQNPIIQIISQYNLAEGSFVNSNNGKVTELEVNTFNQKFENYQSTNLQGVTVKGLLSTIQLNNETQGENRKIKEIHFCGEEYEATEQNMVSLKENVELETAYRVEFEKEEETGLIYRVVVNKK